MPGVLFVVCIPNAEYEKSLIYGTAPAIMPNNDMFNGPGQGIQKGKIFTCIKFKKIQMLLTAPILQLDFVTDGVI